MSSRYGGAHDLFPVRKGQIWGVGPHRFLCADLMTARASGWFDMLLFSGPADMAYTDPPWSIGNLRMFHTLNDSQLTYTFDNLIWSILATLKEQVMGPVFLEMGTGQVNHVKGLVSKAGGRVIGDLVMSYGNPPRPYHLLGLSFNGPFKMDVRPGLHGQAVIDWVASRPGDIFLDPCCGRLVFCMAAVRAGKTAFGCELIDRKLAAGLQHLSQLLHEPAVLQEEL